MESKQPLNRDESFSILETLPVETQVEIMQAPSYLCCVMTARKHTGDLAAATGIARMIHKAAA